LGEILMKQNRSAEAADAFLRAAANGYEQSDAYVSAAAALGRIQRYDEAATYLDKGLKLNPNDANGLELLGNLRYVKNDLPGALDAWERSLKLKPDNANLRKNYEALRGGKPQ
jgi:tetratricopeptide (TPR) repeat protein